MLCQLSFAAKPRSSEFNHGFFKLSIQGQVAEVGCNPISQDMQNSVQGLEFVASTSEGITAYGYGVASF